MRSDRAAAWLVLLGAGITMASFNIWHALHSHMPGYLAWLVGVAPVLIAMGLSHIVARCGGRFLKVVAFLVMLGAMGLSIRATGYVVRLAFGNLWPLFGLVVDAAALVALQVILTPAPDTPDDTTHVTPAQNDTMAVTPPVMAHANGNGKVTHAEQSSVADVIRNNPGLKNAELADLAGVKIRTIQRHRNGSTGSKP